MFAKFVVLTALVACAAAKPSIGHTEVLASAPALGAYHAAPTAYSSVYDAGYAGLSQGAAFAAAPAATIAAAPDVATTYHAAPVTAFAAAPAVASTYHAAPVAAFAAAPAVAPTFGFRSAGYGFNGGLSNGAAIAAAPALATTYAAAPALSASYGLGSGLASAGYGYGGIARSAGFGYTSY